MKFIIDGDLVTGTATGDCLGIEASGFDDTDLLSLRFDGEKIVDVSTVTDWLVDGFGRKRLPAIHGDKDWQAINCDFDNVLILDAGIWRIETDADRFTKAKSLMLDEVVSAANNFTASALNKYPEAERIGWPQKQAECSLIIAADDASTSITTVLNKTVLMKTIATAASWDDATIVVMARTIIAKANEFASIAAMVEVMRSTAETTINEANDWAELDAAKTNLSEQAQVMAAQYGLI